ncbi:uncharacterized protein I303_100154 [Kwoniella dejecticola CBS 10117]|uniref:RRM domain-containing protein n=1 Tax=Kwoniella dejecticola CBS 10117 TaxID=1296121 RepID=A0A1A6AE92_9TREE|nr:uncharacterized protein I303_00154 [Kwoniella dejecticola CBS 10117]OBR88343.1 hypothetical protein I303_00154 [Kwoniella dejecticola CBS 10117]
MTTGLNYNFQNSLIHATHASDADPFIVQLKVIRAEIEKARARWYRRNSAAMPHSSLHGIAPNFKYRVQIEPEYHPQVWAQVIMHLFKNAKKDIIPTTQGNITRILRSYTGEFDCSVHVEGLDGQISLSELEELASIFGKVSSISIDQDEKTGFVTFVDGRTAVLFEAGLEGLKVKNTTLRTGPGTADNAPKKISKLSPLAKEFTSTSPPKPTKSLSASAEEFIPATFTQCKSEEMKEIEEVEEIVKPTAKSSEIYNASSNILPPSPVKVKVKAKHMHMHMETIPEEDPFPIEAEPGELERLLGITMPTPTPSPSPSPSPKPTEEDKDQENVRRALGFAPPKRKRSPLGTGGIPKGFKFKPCFRPPPNLRKPEVEVQ